jgi:hypothetical protein
MMTFRKLSAASVGQQLRAYFTEHTPETPRDPDHVPAKEPDAGAGSRPAAHRFRRRTPGRPETLRPLYYARNANLEGPCRLPAARPAQNRRNHPLTQIQRIGSRYPCRPPAPASILNQKTTRVGNPKSDSDEMNLALVASGVPFRESSLAGRANHSSISVAATVQAGLWFRMMRGSVYRSSVKA